MSEWAIFGGTAAYHLNLSEYATVSAQRVVPTPYGDSALFQLLTPAQGAPVWFSSRHGEGRLQRSAAFVNHRANVWAVRELGARAIVSWNGVGALAPGLQVGQLVVPDDLLDLTRGRVASFGTAAQFTPGGSPFDPMLRAHLVAACAASGQAYATHGTYVCTEGPRLETAAEIQLYGAGGAAIVGMTLAPEVWLAAELGLAYASLCLITNMATGRWALDPRRDFSARIGAIGLQTILAAHQAA